MGDYFKGWRRKMGVATLALACIFMGLWMRSFSRGDFLSSSNCQVVSFRGRVFLHRKAEFINLDFMYVSEDDRHTSDAYNDPHFAHLWQWRWFGFAFGESVVDVVATDGTQSKERQLQYFVPYWSIVIPLTLVSGWLLLSKSKPADTE